MTPVEAMGHAIAVVAAGLRQDRAALAVLVRLSEDDAIATAGGMLDLVRLLAKIVGERGNGNAADIVAAAAAGRSELVTQMAEFAIQVINSGGDLPEVVDAADLIVGLGAIAGRLAELAADEDGSALDVLARIGFGVAELEAFDPPQ